MNILIIHAHDCNRGDEAAVKSMIDELLGIYPEANITLSMNGVCNYPNLPNNVKTISRFPKVRDRMAQIEYFVALITKGKFVHTPSGKEFLDALKESDLVIHAPGGPSIGDIYYKVELMYLFNLNFVRKFNKPYLFYAPSMGPFKRKERSKIRRKVLCNAERVVVRDPISLQYVKDFIPELNVVQTLDSALQHDIPDEPYKEIIDQYTELNDFLHSYDRCIGITITNLKWHPLYKDTDINDRVHEIFNNFIEQRINEGLGIIFIPQLYGGSNDYNVMNEYMRKKGTFIVESENKEYDSYFQQYLIKQLYAVIGMRYHSNIFSAKMNTPFVSISYEQKMKGFMNTIGLSDYCISISDLSYELLEDKYRTLVNNYDEYRALLTDKHQYMKERAFETTRITKEVIDKILLNKKESGC